MSSSVSLAQQSLPVSLSTVSATAVIPHGTLAANNAQPSWPLDPCAEAFPPMQVEEFESLKASIHRNGLRDPLLVWQGRVMDGRHRLKACQALGIVPTVQVLNGSYEEAKSAAFAANINRRHLRTSQRALQAAQLATRQPGQTKAAKAIGPVLSQEEAARLFGVGRDSVQRACRLLAHNRQELLAQVQNGTMSLHEAVVIADMDKKGLVAKTSEEERKALRTAAAVKERLGQESRDKRLRMQAEVSATNLALPSGARYAVVLADPPWDYGMPNDRAASRILPHEQYPTMTTDAVCAMDVTSLAADDAMLFLWCPTSLLQDGLRAMASWGFEYLTNWIWQKTGSQLNCGGGTAMVHHELLLVGKRGKGLSIADTALRKPSVLSAPVTKHSAKPEIFQEQIEVLYPNVGRIELFSRSARAGWAAWGNQAAA